VKRARTTVTILTVSLVGFLVGYVFRDLASFRPPSAEAMGMLVGLKQAPAVTPTALFAEHYSQILARSYSPMPPERLRHRAMEGMFASLGDPHTSFLEPVAAEGLKLETKGDFVGIGARLSPDPMGARIATVFKSSPAEQGGLKPGDLVVAVDGKDAGGTDVNDLVSRIRGKAGTVVRLRVVRAGQDSPLDFDIRREVVVIPTVEGRMLAGSGVAHVTIGQFSETTPTQFRATLRELASARPKGMVLDVRGNPGGLLPAVSQMLGAFLDGKEVVSMRRRYGIKQVVTSPRGQTLPLPFPVAVLVNEDSASAAEIFAGVLQDYRHAVVIGEHTYGKASVQTLFGLADQSSAKITMARYYLPSGRNIERKVDADGQYVSGGLKPDIPVAIEDVEGIVIGEPGKDPQLDAAIANVLGRRRS
jgi:carboxyl-terminal processing protease